MLVHSNKAVFTNNFITRCSTFYSREITMSEERKAKGAVINGYLKFVKKTYGAKGLEDCKAAIGIDPSTIKDGLWYEDAINDRIFTWLEETHGFSAVEKASRYTTKDLGLMSYIVRFVNVKRILKEFPKNYQTLFDYGTLEVEFIDDNNAILRLYDGATSKYSCPAWMGAFYGALEMTKTKGSVEETKCQFKGADHCEFKISWEG